MSFIQSKRNLIIISLVVAVIFILGLFGIYWLNTEGLGSGQQGSDTEMNADSEEEPTSFQECLESGGEVLDTTPSSCSWEGQVFVDNTEKESDDDSPNQGDSGGGDSSDRPTITIELYFTSDELLEQNCGAVQKVNRTVPFTKEVARASLLELFKGPTPEEEERGLQSSFESWTEVFQGVSLADDGTLTIDFSEEVRNFDSKYWFGKFSSACGSGQLQQIEQTVRQFPSVEYVVYTVNGNPEPWADAIVLTGCDIPKSEVADEKEYIQIQKQCGER